MRLLISSLVLSKLPSALIPRWVNANHEPIVKYATKKTKTDDLIISRFSLLYFPWKVWPQIECKYASFTFVVLILLKWKMKPSCNGLMAKSPLHAKWLDGSNNSEVFFFFFFLCVCVCVRVCVCVCVSSRENLKGRYLFSLICIFFEISAIVVTPIRER